MNFSFKLHKKAKHQPGIQETLTIDNCKAKYQQSWVEFNNP